MKAQQVFDVAKGNLGWTFKMLQEREAEIVANLAGDTSAAREFGQLAADLFTLTETLLDDVTTAAGQTKFIQRRADQ